MIEAQEQNLSLSSRKRRIAAFMIDHFAMSFLMVSIFFLSLGPDWFNGGNGSSLFISMIVVMIPGIILYFAKDSIKGISIGKWIMGIMVRDATNHNNIPSFQRLLVRNLFAMIWPVEFIVLASSPEKKRLGDKTANTVVVKNPDKPVKLPRIAALACIGIGFFTFTLLFTGQAMKNSDAYKVAISAIEQDKEILKEIGGIKGYGMIPSGGINISNGYGQAQLEINVIGNTGELNVSVYLTKEPNGKWELIEMNK